MILTTFSKLGLQPSFGFGDRTGFAAPGQIQAMRRAGAGLAPIFAQQSIREMTRTGRTPHEVIDAAVAAIHRDWNGASGADADHLKTINDVELTSAAGFTFFTIDPSDFVDQNADDYDESILRERFQQIRSMATWCSLYINHPVPLPNGRSFKIDEQSSVRCAVKYGRAIEHSIAMGKHVCKVSEAANQPFELELSIDETRQPTSLAEHFVIADQLRRANVDLISIAPKFPGDFEKGVEYKGDLACIQQSMNEHAVLAREMGPYKVSLHSGSDKLLLYPILARATHGCFHVKTSGTSYLEALRVVARHDSQLFRNIVDVARRHYETDRATYHVTANLDTLPTTNDDIKTDRLEDAYLGRWSDVPSGQGFAQPGRQVLHCTFGTILSDRELRNRIQQILRDHSGTYAEFLADHFTRHLRALTSAL